MKDDRLRVPVEDAYLHAIGLAMFCFARLEWEAIYCCEKIAPGYLKNVSKKFAGEIAKDLAEKASSLPNQLIGEKLKDISEKYKNSVRHRNDLVHAKPASTSNNQQQLIRNGDFLSIEQINTWSDSFAALSISLNHIHHNDL